MCVCVCVCVQVFVVRLGAVTGGARVEVSRSTATLTVPENDSPYGVLSFASETCVAVETGDDGSFVTTIPVIRRSEFIQHSFLSLYIEQIVLTP